MPPRSKQHDITINTKNHMLLYIISYTGLLFMAFIVYDMIKSNELERYMHNHNKEHAAKLQQLKEEIHELLESK